MIIFDTETTGLPKPEAAPIEQQPKIIEFAAIKLEDEPPYVEIDRMEFLCNPGEPLESFIVKHTGITDAMLKDKKSFAGYLPQLANFFLGTRYLIAQNISFDRKLLKYELARVGAREHFPWPPIHQCTMLAGRSFTKTGKWPNLAELYKIATGKTMKEAHRAMVDVEHTVESALWLIEQGKIRID